MSNSGMKAFLKRSVSFLVTAAIVVISVSVSATVSDDYAKAFDAYYSARPEIDRPERRKHSGAMGIN